MSVGIWSAAKSNQPSRRRTMCVQFYRKAGAAAFARLGLPHGPTKLARSTTVAFLLGFLVNCAFSRWWEGATRLGQAITEYRNAVSHLAATTRPKKSPEGQEAYNAVTRLMVRAARQPALRSRAGCKWVNSFEPSNPACSCACRI